MNNTRYLNMCTQIYIHIHVRRFKWCFEICSSSMCGERKCVKFSLSKEEGHVAVGRKIRRGQLCA